VLYGDLQGENRPGGHPGFGRLGNIPQIPGGYAAVLCPWIQRRVDPAEIYLSSLQTSNYLFLRSIAGGGYGNGNMVKVTK